MSRDRTILPPRRREDLVEVARTETAVVRMDEALVAKVLKVKRGKA